MTQTTASEGEELEDALGAGVFRDLFAWTGDAIVVADAEGRYLDANQAATVLLGYARDELLQLRVADVVARQPEWTAAEYTRFLREGRWRGELEVRRKDGVLVPVEALATAAPLATGTVYVSALRDISEHKRLQAELAVRVRQQGVVADLGQRALRAVDLDALLGETVGIVAATLEVEYTAVLERLPDVDTLRLRAGVGWREGVVGYATVGAETDSQPGYTLLNDEPVIVTDQITETRFSAPPLLHEHGIVSGLSVIIPGRERPYGVLAAHTRERRDFTPDDALFLRSVAYVLAAAIERQRIEDEARENRFRALVEHSSDLISIVDSDGIRCYASPSYESILGYQPEELVGHPFTKLNHPDDEEAERRFLAKLSQNPGATDRITVRLRHADGSWRWIEVNATNRLDDPAVGGLVVNARDITERMQLEQKVRLSLEAAGAGIRAQSQFLAMMSHELRTPMQAVLGYADLLLIGGQNSLNPEQVEDVQTIRRGAERMMVLVSQMLDLSRLEAGRMELAVEPVDLGKIIEQVRQDVAPQAAAKGLALQTDLPLDLPLVFGDSMGIHQVLLNLVANAVKFTWQGSVRITPCVVDDGVTVAVRDTGIGIAEDALPQIFEEFRQVDNGMTRRHEGAGLGLAIARMLAKQMGGRISVESRSGVGSTFTLHLPAATLATAAGGSPDTSTE